MFQIAMIEDEELSKLNDVELKNLAINCYSCIKENGKKEIPRRKVCHAFAIFLAKAEG